MRLCQFLVEHMMWVCTVYNVNMGELEEPHEDVAGDLLEGKVDYFLADHPYNVRDERNMDQSSHEGLTREDMTN